MPRLLLRVCVLIPLIALLSGAFALEASAEDLGILVERTGAPDARLPIVVTSDQPGPITVRRWQVADKEVHARAGGGERTPEVRGEAAFEGSFQIEKAGVRQRLDLPPAPAGLHVIEISRGEQLRARATALVSDLAIVTKRHAKGVLVWAVRRSSGAPWAGVAVDVPGPVAQRGVTDARGIWQSERPVPPEIRIRAAVDGHWAFGDDTWFSPDVNDRRVYAFAHQPAYRPGERVEVKGIVRRYRNGVYSIDSAVREVLLQLRDGEDKIVEATTVPVTEDVGTFHGGFDLDEKARTGAWRIVATIAGDEYEAPLRVEAYRKPPFEVRVRSDQPRTLAGGKVRFTIRASFYDGGTLNGAAVTWQLVHNRIDKDLFPSDEMMRLFFGSEQTAYQPQTLQTGKGSLSATGTLVVEATAPPEAQDGWLTLRATITGPDRIAVAGSHGLEVAAAPLRVGLETDKHLYGPEDVAAVTVRVERADGGQAAELDGVLSLDRLERDGAWRSAGAGRYPLKTDVRGHARLNVPLPGEGQFRIQAAFAAKGQAKPIQAHVLVWAAAERPTVGEAPKDLQVLVDKDRHAAGETARILVRAPQGLAVLATLEGTALHRAEVLRPEAGAALWEVELTAEHAPNVFVTFALVDGATLRLETRMLRIPPVERLLRAEIVPDNTSLKPGATSGVTLRIVDAAGKPVPDADVSLSIVDDALHAIHRDPGAELAAFFHPARRNAVQTRGPLEHDSVGFGVFTPPRKKAKGDSGGIEDGRSTDGAIPPGERAPGDPQPPTGGGPRPARRGGGAPSSPVPSPEPSPQPGPAGSEEREEAEAMPDDEDEHRSGRDLDGRTVTRTLLLKKSGHGHATEPLKVRTDFRTCVHWEPARKTDAKGLVRIESIRFAESLTRWRISVRVIDAQTRVGTATALVVTEKKLSARITAPRFLTTTDRSEVPVLLRNLTATPVEAAYELEAVSGERASSEDGPILLAAGATAVRYLPLQAGSTGEARIRAVLRGPTDADAEERRIPVLPQGIERVRGHAMLSDSGRIVTKVHIPEHAVPGTIECRVSIEPSTLSAVAAALPYLSEYPHGCTEQTMSRFVPLTVVASVIKELGVPTRGVLADVPKMIDAGVKRLATLRQRDGGYGWWPSSQAGAAMTAHVLRGLNAAAPHLPKSSEAHAMRQETTNWLLELRKNAKRRQGLDAETDASVLLALAGAGVGDKSALSPYLQPDAMRSLSPLARAWLLRTAVQTKHTSLIYLLRQDLESAASRVEGQASWGPSQPAGGLESPTREGQDSILMTAEVAYALLLAEGDEELLADAGRWLLLHRPAGERWRSTRDTAAAVRFLAAHAAKTGDLGVGKTIRASVDAVGIGEVLLTKETIFGGTAVLDLPSAMLVPGKTLDLTLSTERGSFTAGVHVSFFETGPAIREGGNGITVERRWYVLRPSTAADGQVTWTRTPMTESVPSGALVECEIEVRAPEAREYVMVTDPHAAGFEPVREYGMNLPDRAPASKSQVEGYDDRTLFFLTQIPAGKTILRHTVRATHVGTFTALPAQAELMYYPEVRGNSRGELLEITATGPAGVATRKDGAR